MQAKNKDSSGEERRKAKRILVQESFSFFIVIPSKLGMARVYMRDISVSGLSFWTDQESSFQKGNEFKIRLYTGPTLYLPVAVRVVRAGGNEIAVEFADKSAKSVQALARFLDFLDMASEAAVIEVQT